MQSLKAGAQLRWRVRTGAATLLSISIGVMLSGCGEGRSAPTQAPKQGAMPVHVVTAQTADVAVGNDWVGALDGFVNAQIQPQVGGYLVHQNYREGAVVNRGDVLFEIDPRPFQAALDQSLGQIGQAQGQMGQAEGQLAQAEAQLRLTDINVARDTPLAEQHAIAQSQLDSEKQQRAQAEANVKTAKAAIASAQAAIESAKANASTARLNLDFTKVRSLITGVAGQATTQVGNLVNPQSVLTSVSQLDPIKAYFSLSDSEYLGLTRRSGQRSGDLLRNAATFPLTLTLADGTVFPRKGHIAFVDRQVNAQTGAIRIAASFPNPGNILRPGQFGRVSAETQTIHGALLVPQIAVSDLQGVKQVYTVASGNKVHLVNVNLGPQSGQNWVVNSGLAPGTQIITDNLQKLAEGMPVDPKPAPAAAPASVTAQASGNKSGE